MARAWVKTGLANRFRITFLDGTVEEVQAIPGDAMAWERLNKKPFQDNIGAGLLLWTAWRALRREKRTDATNFENWADTIADYEMEAEDDDQDDDDPTQPAL